MKKTDGYIQARPKKTRQGQGKHSKPTGNKKKYRGQGK